MDVDTQALQDLIAKIKTYEDVTDCFQEEWFSSADFYPRSVRLRIVLGEFRTWVTFKKDSFESAHIDVLAEVFAKEARQRVKVHQATQEGVEEVGTFYPFFTDGLGRAK